MKKIALLIITLISAPLKGMDLTCNTLNNPWVGPAATTASIAYSAYAAYQSYIHKDRFDQRWGTTSTSRFFYPGKRPKGTFNTELMAYEEQYAARYLKQMYYAGGLSMFFLLMSVYSEIVCSFGPKKPLKHPY